MKPFMLGFRRLAGGLALGLVLIPAFAAAQTAVPQASPSPEPPKAAASPAPFDGSSIRFGTTIFTNFTYTQAPTVKDVDGNVIHTSAFDVTRAYLNLAGSINRLLSFRVTADVSRLASAGATSATSLDGSETFRLKYAYGQVSLDSVLPKGSWVRLGAQPTPLLDFTETVYQYRFQGTQMVERDGYMSSSDFGLTSKINPPDDFGDIHAGIYNGETYARGETNNQKSFQIRGTLRPFPKKEVGKGLRLTAFYNADRYVQDAPRKRFVGDLSFEHKYFVASAELLEASDQVSKQAPLIRSNAYSVWTRLKTTIGVEGLLRYDSVQPDEKVEGRRKRTIVGVAYWFKTKAPLTAAVLVDYEGVTYPFAANRPRETRFALHSLFGF